MNEINFEIKDDKTINLTMDVGIKEIYPPIENLEVTPTKQKQTFTHEGSYGYDNVTVDPIPEEYIIPDGTLPITENTTYDVRRFAKVTASVHPTPNLQDKEVTPTKETQTITYDEDYDGLGNVTVNAISSEYIIPSGTIEITTNGTHTVKEYENATVNIPTPTINLQDKTITITENGTQNIVADEGYVGLNSVEVTTNVAGGGEPVVEPDYITDGLISWWEGEDGFDTNGNWNSRVGTDYIKVVNFLRGDIKTNPPYFGSNFVFNNGSYAMTTQQDYCVQNYTIQAVGYFDGNISTSNTGMNMLIAMNMGASPMIGINGRNEAMFANGSNLSQGASYNVLKKIFSGTLHLTDAPTRGNVNSALNLLGSVNGSDWFTSTAYTSTHPSKGNNMTVLCYYTESYKSCGARLYSLRVYNRKLTLEELQHNYEIDKARFNITE